MSDLTERLRTSDGFKVSMASDGHPYIHADKELLTEAAARIEELEAALREMRDADRARIEELEDALAKARHCISKHRGGCINGCWEATEVTP